MTVSETPRNSHAGSSTLESKFFAIGVEILSIPRTDAILSQVDAIVAWPGIVLDLAVKHAVLRWNKNCGKHLLVAGYHEPEVAEAQFALENVGRTMGLTRFENVHSQVHAGHAGMQAAWVAEKVQELDIKSFALYVPAFHLPRATLTTIESLRRLGIRVPIIPVPTPMDPLEWSLLDVKTGERNLCQMDVIHSEADPRMKSYQMPKADRSPGDVATDELWREYLYFLYEHPLMMDELLTAV